MKTKLTLNLWVLVFIGTAFFHIWRGSVEDAYIFGTASILMLSQVMGFTNIGFKQKPHLSIWVIAILVIAVAAVLYLAPPHSFWSAITLLALLPTGLALIFYVDAKAHPSPSKQVLKARLSWGLWAFVFAVIELIAFIGGFLTSDDSSFPTISIILDPVLETQLGRAVFVALWLMAGIYLLGVRKKR